MNKINRMISKYNYTPGNSSRIKYIVIHYVGALDGAKENCIYYGGGIVDHLHTILSGLTVRSGSV